MAVVAVSRIYGVPWAYLMYWAFGIGALMLLSIVATVVVVLRRWQPVLAAPRVTALSGYLGLAVTAAVSIRLLAVAPDATTASAEQTEQLGRLLPGTVAALEEGVGAASGHAGHYNVLWDDATNGGAEGIGLVNELVRRGYDVGVRSRDGVQIGLHRVRSDDAATARVVLASGGWIERWAAEPGAVRVALDDPRTAREREEFDETRQAAAAALRAAGRDDLVERLDVDLFDVALNQDAGPDINLLLGRMLDIGVPVAVFVVPPAASS